MKNTYLLIFELFLGMNLMAQSIDRNVMAAAGEGSHGNTMQLQWTLGESFDAYFYAESTLMTEGFNQPEIPDILSFSATDTDVISAELGKLQASVYPNPFSDGFILSLTQKAETTLCVSICTVYGGELYKANLPIDQQQMEFYFNSLTAGYYLVKLTNHDTGELMRVIKVAKTGR